MPGRGHPPTEELRARAVTAVSRRCPPPVRDSACSGPARGAVADAGSGSAACSADARATDAWHPAV